MRGADVVAAILKREGTEVLIGYPVNPIIEAAARADIRTLIVRQERTGIHMADALSRATAGERVGVFAMQHGPGAENSFGAVAQAYADSVPLVVLPAAYERRLLHVPPHFSAAVNYRHVTKHCETVMRAADLPAALQRAFARARNGRPRPVLVECPVDVLAEEVPQGWDYREAPRARSAPNPDDVGRAAELLLAARRPVIYAGQGVHYARAWAALREVAERLEAPVTTSLQGKSAFDEFHPLSLGAGGRSMPGPVHHFLGEADLVLGVGCSFAATKFGVPIPPGKTVVHATLDPDDLNGEVPADCALVGDARLTLEALAEELPPRGRGRRAAVEADIREARRAWLAEWRPRLESEAAPLSPYRVIAELMAVADPAGTIITHDAGSPRDQLSPFWRCAAPLTYLGWGKTTQLGYGLGLALGAKLAHPDKLCVNVWGDAAIGFTGMDLETAVRERLPILSVLFNNFSMAMEIPKMQAATEKYRSTDISGNYAELAHALGGHGERVSEPAEIRPALERAISRTREGVPALVECLTGQETTYSVY